MANISFQSALGLREESLKLRAERASVLSSNLANTDTPNYQARDIDFNSVLKERMGDSSTVIKPQATKQGHIGFDSAHSMTADRLYRVPHQPSIDGNTVEEHVEHAEFMKNSLEFQTSFTLLNSSFKGLRKAIKGE